MLSNNVRSLSRRDLFECAAFDELFSTSGWCPNNLVVGKGNIGNQETVSVVLRQLAEQPSSYDVAIASGAGQPWYTMLAVLNRPSAHDLLAVYVRSSKATPYRRR